MDLENQTIIGGLGSHFDLSLKHFDINEPNATSTSTQVKSRDALINKHLKNVLQNGPRSNVARSQSQANSQSNALITQLNLEKYSIGDISPPKNTQQLLDEIKSRGNIPKRRNSLFIGQASMVQSFPIINIENHNDNSSKSESDLPNPLRKTEEAHSHSNYSINNLPDSDLMANLSISKSSNLETLKPNENQLSVPTFSYGKSFSDKSFQSSFSTEQFENVGMDYFEKLEENFKDTFSISRTDFSNITFNGPFDNRDELSYLWDNLCQKKKNSISTYAGKPVGDFSIGIGSSMALDSSNFPKDQKLLNKEFNSILPLSSVENIKHHRDLLQKEVLFDRDFVLPSEIAFPRECVPTLTSLRKFVIKNNTFKNLVVHFYCENVTLNNKPWTGEGFLKYEEAIQIVANSAYEMRFIFCPHETGIYHSKIKCMVYDPMNNQRIYTKLIDVTAGIALPNVEVLCDKLPMINFGCVPETCHFVKEISITNKSTHALSLIATIGDIHGSHEILYFADSNDQNKCVKKISQSRMSLELRPNATNKVILNLRAPYFDYTDDDGKSKEINITCKINITLDVPLSSSLLIKQIDVKATVGEIRLRTVKNIIPLVIKSNQSGSGCAAFHILNESNLDLYLTAKVSDVVSSSQDSNKKFLDESKLKESFSVEKPWDILKPGMEENIWILYTHKTGQPVKSYLLLTIEPDGTTLEIPIEGIVDESDIVNQPETKLINANSYTTKDEVVGNLDDKNRINRSLKLDCNWSRYNFGCVTVCGISEKKLVLHNKWQDLSVTIGIIINGSEAFTLYAPTDTTVEKSKMFYVTIEPASSKEVVIYFRPMSVQCYSANIIMKPKGLSKPCKVTFLVQGLGGKGILSLIGLNRGEKLYLPSYEYDSSSGIHSSKLLLQVKNYGSRSVFAKFSLILDELNETPVDSSAVSIYPSQFVLGPQVLVKILVTFTKKLEVDHRNRICIIQASYSEELLRSRFRASVANKTTMQSSLQEFCLPFLNEGSVVEKCDLPFLEEEKTLSKSLSRLEINLFAKTKEDETVMQSVLEETDASILVQHSEKNKITNSEKVLYKKFTSETSTTNNWDIPSFKVHPSFLNFKSDEPFFKNATIFNDSNQEQIVEVSCVDPWIKIHPMECLLAPCENVNIKVSVDAGLLAKYYNMPIHRLKMNHFFEVYCCNVKQQVKYSINQKISSPVKLGLNSDIVLDGKDFQEHRLGAVPEYHFGHSRVDLKIKGLVKLSNFSLHQQLVTLSLFSEHFKVIKKCFKIEGKCFVQVPVFYAPISAGYHVENLIVIGTINGEQTSRISILLIGEASV